MSNIVEKQSIVSFVKQAITTTEKYGRNHSFDENIKYCCEIDPIYDAVVVTDTTPQLIMKIKAFRSKCQTYIYWFVGCDVSVALRTIGLYSINYEFDQQQEGYQIEKEPFNCYFWGRAVENELVHNMLKYLCMTDSKLIKRCGRYHPLEYRLRIIENLDNLWN
jgi:hypothetical protein